MHHLKLKLVLNSYILLIYKKCFMILSKNNKKSTIKIYFIFFLDINKNYYIIHSITFLTFLTFIKMHDKKCEMKLY